VDQHRAGKVSVNAGDHAFSQSPGVKGISSNVIELAVARWCCVLDEAKKFL
jgi:hypothetical protein